MKAVVLISGGLDSSLAVKAIQNQGIKVVAIHFIIPFVKYNINNIGDNPAKKIAEQLKCKFKAVVLGNEYLEMLKKPRYGYGKNCNPCIDCKILMLKQAKSIMKKEKASFVATGEVLEQRPMSQNKQTLGIIERESGLEGLLVRPLSALLLPETIPQQKGWIKKEFLFDIKGRGRRRQMNLAGEWGITDYPWPGGGCLLTDPSFSRRLKDIMRNGTLTLDNIELLKIGRHFKIRPKFKLIVGRNEEENKKLISIARPGDTVFEPLNVPGPTGIGRGLYDEDVKSVSSKIIARYTAEDKKISVKVTHRPTNLKEIFKVSGISEGEIVRLRI